MVLSVAFPTYAGVFFDDFADGIANGWHEIAGEWEMLDGAYTLKAPSEKPDQIAMSILDSPWVITDATITFTISFDERDVTGAERPMVFFRLEEDDSGYAFRFEGEPKGTTIGMIEVGVWSSIRGDATDAIELDEPSTIRLEIAANIFMVYHNDVLRQRVGDVKRKFEMGRGRWRNSVRSGSATSECPRQGYPRVGPAQTLISFATTLYAWVPIQ